jgi:hypothetical protein
VSDIDLWVGGDLGLSASNDLQLVYGTTQGEQTLVRGLLTNPEGYVFHPTFGAGLPRKVGSPFNRNEIIGLVRAQMFKSRIALALPAPNIAVDPIPNTNGGFELTVSYADNPTGLTAGFTYQIQE